MDKKIEKIFEERVEEFKKNWHQFKHQEPTEKIVWYFNEGMKKRHELIVYHQPVIVAERFLEDVLLKDDKHYPTWCEFKDCKQAFSLGFFEDLS